MKRSSWIMVLVCGVGLGIYSWLFFYYIADPVVSGRVIDHETGNPVHNAWVLGASGYSQFCPLEGGGCSCIVEIEQVTRTDQQGNFIFDKNFEYGSLLGKRFGFIQVYAPGYTASPDHMAEYWQENYAKKSDYWVINGSSQLFFKASFGYADSLVKRTTGKNNVDYYLTSSPPYEVNRTSKKRSRLIYLRDLAKYFGANCRHGKKHRPVKGKLLRAIYAEAETLVESEDDEKLLASICRKALGRVPNETIPCKIR